MRDGQLVLCDVRPWVSVAPCSPLGSLHCSVPASLHYLPLVSLHSPASPPQHSLAFPSSIPRTYRSGDQALRYLLLKFSFFPEKQSSLGSLSCP